MKTIQQLEKVSHSDKMYVAALFEGEGYAGICSSGKGRMTRPVVNIGMTDKEPIIFVQKLFPGCICREKLVKSKKIILRYVASHQKALNFDNKILPFCKSKRKKNQLKTIIDYYKTRRLVNERYWKKD